MAYNFPDSPTPGQVFQQWTWNGSAWVLTPPTIVASSIPFTPTGDIAATNVQDALVEIDTEMHAAVAGVDLSSRVAKAGDTMTGVLNTVGVTMGSVVAASATDLSKHLNVWGTNNYGMCVTSSTLNIVAGGAASLKVVPGGINVTGALNNSGDINATRPASPTTGYIFLGNGGQYLGFNGSVLVGTGQTLWHSGNLTPSTYLSNGRLPYAGDSLVPNTGYADLIAHGLLSGTRGRWDYTSTYITPDGFRLRYVQGYTTGWFTFAFA